MGVYRFVCEPTTVTGVVYLDILEEFSMPVLEEEGPNDALFKHYRASAFSHCSAGLFLRKFPW